MARRIEVTFETTVPDEATDDQIDEWVGFHLGVDSIKNGNPLIDQEFSTPSLVFFNWADRG